MVDTVMTMGRSRVNALLRGTSTAPIGGDFRDITFVCRFSTDAVNGGAAPAPKPQIQVTVSTLAPPHLFAVEIFPPGGQREVLARGSQGGRVSWARPVVLEGDRPKVAPRSTTRRAIGFDWVLDDPFGDFGDASQPVDPIGPGRAGGGSGARPYTRLLDPATDETGTWTVRIRNRSQDDQQFMIMVDYPETVQKLRETRIPFQLINRTFAQALLAMQLSIHIDNGRARIAFDKTFRELTGVENLNIPVNDRLQDINLQEFTVEMGNVAGTPTIIAGLDLEDRGDEIGGTGPNANVDDMAIVCRVLLSFGYRRDSDFFETAMRRENGQIVRRTLSISTFLDTNPDIEAFWVDLILAIAEKLGFADESSVYDYIQAAIDDAEIALRSALHKAASYFHDVIMHLVNRDSVLFKITADDDAIIVLHHRRPSIRDFLDDASPDADPVIDAEVSARTAVVAVQASSSLAVETPAATGGASSSSNRRLREGEIDHIVVLMMENRSFDHMLGYRHFSHSDVNGLTGNESNPFPQGAPYDVYHLAATSGIRSPDHGFEATLEQISDGTMTGFVTNYAKRSGVVDPGVVMSYYDGTELPMYEFLANNFAICDAWHSAHLGETQCNRFATLTGVTPELTNFELSDPRLGYYRGDTIFDYLTEEGVDWVYAEGNVAFLRMFDKYRVDVSHVIPYQDDHNQGIEDTFVQRVRDGRLPSVSFIDPRYLDIPPAWDANDDLPPADVCRGQQLVSHVYSLMLSNKQTWLKTMLIVTYDEHGGFFDHATPLGMATSRDPTSFPRLHPDGPQHLGVRVPAFVVSPWIDGGTVLHTTYDHTSILKTILQRFAPADYPIADRFGPRTAAANGLLSEQLRTSPRRRMPPQAPSITCKQPIGPTGPSAELDSRDFHLSMRLLGLPAKYRDRAAY